MENLSKRKRDEMIAFLEFLKKQHSDDDSLMAINSIERELTAKKYGLIWEEHQEEVDKKMETHIPVFSEVPEYEVMEDEHNTTFNFLLEGDNLHSLNLLEKTNRGKVNIIYIDPPIIRETKILYIMMNLLEERIYSGIQHGFLSCQKDCVLLINYFQRMG